LWLKIGKRFMKNRVNFGTHEIKCSILLYVHQIYVPLRLRWSPRPRYFNNNRAKYIQRCFFPRFIPINVLTSSHFQICLLDLHIYKTFFITWFLFVYFFFHGTVIPFKINFAALWPCIWVLTCCSQLRWSSVFLTP